MNDVDMAYVAADIVNYKHALTRWAPKVFLPTRNCPPGGTQMIQLAQGIVELLSKQPITLAVAEPDPNLWGSMFALQGLVALIARFPPSNSSPADSTDMMLRNLVARNWRNIWRWVKRGTDRALHQETRPLPEDIFFLLFAAISQVIRFCAEKEFGFERAIYDEGYNVVIDLWYIEILSPALDVVVNSAAHSLSKWLGREFSKHEAAYMEQEGLGVVAEKHWKQITDQTGRTTADLVELLLQRFLRLQTKLSTLGSPPIISHVDVMLLVIQSPSARQCLNTTNSTYFFTRFLVNSTRLLRDIPERTEDIMDVVDASASYLLTAISSSDGFAVVNESLRAGLILGILRSAQRNPTEDSKELCDLVENLRIYLVYISVLRSVAKTVITVRDIDLLERGLHKGGSFWQVWSDFKDVLDSRLLVAADSKTPLHKTCCNEKACTVHTTFIDCSKLPLPPKCNVTDDQVKLKQCFGCKHIIYCSTKCQRADWQRHRNFCKDAQASLQNGHIEEGESVLSKEDGDFAKVVLRVHLKLKAGEVNARLDRRSMHVLVHVDYTHLPPETSFTDVAEPDSAFKDFPATYACKLPFGRRDLTLMTRIAHNGS
ncbi:hypothetical protein DXG01_004161 [Tephrocybe rancida]|nr:hypothetical protein DXG01_004161 [Tephrocybe rancida]